MQSDTDDASFNTRMELQAAVTAVRLKDRIIK